MSEPIPPAQQLRIPGPTPLPERVLQASSRQMISHRGSEFSSLLAETLAGIGSVLRTENDVLLFPASGTGGLEAVVTNLLSPGEPAVFASCGAFGKRWADIATACGVDVIHADAPSGEPATPEVIGRALDQNPKVRKVFVTHNETSTGVTNDIPAIATVVKERGKLLCVDSVSGAGCLPLETDELGLDVVVTASQKGWMAPPGLTMIAVSQAALEAASEATLPRWYFDFHREKRYQDKQQTYITPPVSVLYSLHEGLRMIAEEGVAETWRRHARIGSMIRAGVEALGLTLFAQEDARSNTVTAVSNPTESPPGLKELTSYLRERRGLVLAGGQDDLQGKIFRIGHLGWIGDQDVYAILESLEDGLLEFHLIERGGTAVPAARRAAESLSPVAAL